MQRTPTVMQHKPPIDPTTLSRWRSRLGAERLEILLQQTIQVARRTGQLRKPQLEKINVDTTVQPKAIAFPTDARLYFKAARSLVRLAQNAGVVLRRSYKFTNITLLVMQGRYARAKHYRRARKCERKLRTHLGCLLRDVSRKLTSLTNQTHREALEQLLTIVRQIFKQQRTDSPKIYSVPARLVCSDRMIHFSRNHALSPFQFMIPSTDGTACRVHCQREGA